MKKNLFFHFSVLAMLIVLISACSSKKPEYTNVIPSDASQVIAVNLKSLADKAGTKDKETKEALQKLTDALKSDMNAATFQQLEAVLNQLLADALHVAVENSVGQFVGLLDRVAAQRLEGLLAVPRALFAQFVHDLQQSQRCRGTFVLFHWQ